MMKKLTHLSMALIIFLLLSCASNNNDQDDPVSNPYADAQAEIHEVIKSIVNDAEKANIKGLKEIHLKSEKFSKFGPRNFNRQDVGSTNDSEEAFFGSIENYKQEIVDLKVDVFGEVAVATYYPHVSYVQDGQEKNGSGRQTFVFLNTDEGWKLVHEHGTPKVQ